MQIGSRISDFMPTKANCDSDAEAIYISYMLEGQIRKDQGQIDLAYQSFDIASKLSAADDWAWDRKGDIKNKSKQ